MARQIGYRIRPSFIWTFKRDRVTGLVIGLANDGIAPVPGVLRLSVVSADGTSTSPVASTLDIPNRPGFIRQC